MGPTRVPAGQLGELRKPLAQRVDVHVEAFGRLGVAAVQLEEGAQRRLQTAVAAAVVCAERAQDALGEPAQRVVVEQAEEQSMVVELRERLDVRSAAPLEQCAAGLSGLDEDAAQTPSRPTSERRATARCRSSATLRRDRSTAGGHEISATVSRDPVATSAASPRSTRKLLMVSVRSTPSAGVPSAATASTAT
jgi:hypothetical protein